MTSYVPFATLDAGHLAVVTFDNEIECSRLIVSSWECVGARRDYGSLETKRSSQSMY